MAITLLCVGMAWERPTGLFNVERLKADVFAPVGGWNDKVDAKSPWQNGAIQQAPKPSYQDDEVLKKRFGIELAKAANSFDAAVKIFPDDTSKSLWISYHWIGDPVVIAARDVYLKTMELSSVPLDREQLAAKVLALSEEKILNPRLGVMLPIVEPKDRIAALKLYSEILGYTGKVEIDNSIKNTTINELTVKLVRPEVKAVPTITQAPNIKSEILNENPSPITLKLVSGNSR